MAYKLAVDNLVGVKVEGKNTGADGNVQPFKFTLVCERKSADDLQAAIADKEVTVAAFIEKVARDWQGQKLVLQDDDTPAPFNAEALKALLSITGMASLCWHSYVQQVQATAKN